MFYRLKRKLSGRKIKRYTFTLTFMVAIFVMSLGYAALSQYMEIEGMAIVQKLWNVYVLEVTQTSTNGGSGLGRFETSQNVVSLQTTLPNLDSTVTYTITFKNSGNVKGILHSIDQIEDKNINITYSISGVSVGSTIAASGTTTATVTVQYKQGATSISTEPKKMMLQFNFVEDTSSSGGSSDSGGNTTVTLSSKILADNTAQSDSGIDFTKVSSATNGQGLYRTDQDALRLGTSYYFRGDTTLNNFVKFGKYPANTTINGVTYTTSKDIYWRIIRINEDGNIRLLYAGVDPNTTSDDLIGYGPYNTSPPYIGNDNLRYNYGALTSDLKYALDNWYSSYMLSYASYIGDSTFCNDMGISDGSGFEDEYTEYMAYHRVFYQSAANPDIYGHITYYCEENSVMEQDSVYTVANENLTYPIGTVTLDELVYAGAAYMSSSSASTYFHVDTSFWTMTPLYFSTAMAGPGVASYNMNFGGITDDGADSASLGYRPVINLKSTVTLSSTNPSGCSSQNGSASCPYVIYTGSSSGTTTSYTVSVTSTNTSYGTISPSSTTVASGSSATFTLSPKSGYKYSSNTCGGTVSGNTMTISNVTANKTCTVTFVTTGTTLSSKILSDNIPYADNVSSTYVSASTGIDFSAISSDTNGKGLYYTSTNTENNQKTYYFRGNVTNNYVQFGTDSNGNKLYWKIIRINEDGSVRLIYNGTSSGATGSDVSIDYSEFNTNYYDNAYLGYMHGITNADLSLNFNYPTCVIYNAAGEWEYDDNENGCSSALGGTWVTNAYEATHANEKDSDVKMVLDNWYTNNLSSYSSYLADTGFCNDRIISSGSGYGNETTDYGPYNRLYNNKTPQFACPQTNDLFTTNTSTKGNKALTYPIGLITADEIAYAGGVAYSDNKNYYLYTGQRYWTISPADGVYFANFSTFSAYMFAVEQTGKLSYNSSYVHYSYGVRPVINLKSTVTLSSTNPSGCSSQNGSSSCPYVISTN